MGSSTPTACAAGTYNNATEGSDQTDCIECTPGYYCSGTSNPFPTDVCSAGYYCEGGSDTPTKNATDPGYYSPAGASLQTGCDPGTYTQTSANAECTDCPERFYCPNTASTTWTDCPAGHYCEPGTHTPTRCPAGTYSDQTNRGNVTECVSCDAGKYCFTNGLTEPTGDCREGFFCPGGQSVDNPVNYPCPTGSYCPAGSSSPDACPAGTYNPSTGLTNVTSCLDCTPGDYCDVINMTAPAGEL